jgi:hypothetical protein
MQRKQSQMLCEEEPIFDCLRQWLKSNPDNEGKSMTSGELCNELSRVAGSLKLSWPYNGAKSLGQRLSHIMTNLEADFSVDVSSDSSGQKHYAFSFKAETQDRGYSGEGERRFRREAERRSGAKVNSSRSEATLA